MDRVRFSPASLLARIVAVGVDVLLGFCAMLIALMVASQKGWNQIQSTLLELESGAPVPAELLTGMLVSSFVGASLPFLFAMQVTRYGATPGKALMSLTVRNLATGRFPDYARALGREAIRFVHIAPLMVIGELSVLVVALVIGVIFDMSRTRLSQTWYDRLLKTVIVAPIAERE